MKIKLLASASVFLFVAACASNNNFRPADFTGERVDGKRVGARELKEKDVLGESPRKLSDAAISEVLDDTKSFQIAPGSTVLLVQSGAASPDNAMVEELAPHFSLVPHTGVAAQVCTQPGERIARALRFDAARAKADTIMVVWGNLEV